MIGQWFYGRGSDISGPVTGQELSTMASNGSIVVTDTIWQDGNDDGVVASQVKNLFPSTTVVVDASIPGLELVMITDPILEMAPTVVVAPLEMPILKPEARKGRATAGKGATIVGQDGKTVKFRMKCTVCKYEDQSWKSIAIPRGTQHTSFFCPKCRKRRDTEVTGYW